MKPFTDWLKKEQNIVEPTGLEAVKRRILEAPEPQYEPDRPRYDPKIKGKPSLSNVLSSIRGTRQEPPVVPRQQSSFRQRPISGEGPKNARGIRAISRLREVGDSVKQQIADGNFRLGGRRTTRLSAPMQAVFDRLGDERFHPIIAEFAEEYVKSNSQQSIDDWNERNNFETAEDVIKFLEDPKGMGMIRNARGKLIPKPRTPAQNMAAGRSPGPGASFQPYRGITPKEREIYRDDDKIGHVLANRGGTSGVPITYESMRQFHKAAQKNGLSTEEVRKVMQEINESDLRSLINIGAPPAGIAFNPPEGWNATPNSNSDGEWDGDTDYDTSAFDPDRQQAFNSAFGQAGMGRVESYLQRLINSGFRTEDTMLPVRSLDDITEDHIIGKELAQDLGVEDFQVDAPINRALISSNVNQVKSGANAALGKDSFNKAIESIRGEDKLEQQFLEILGGHKEGTEYEDELEDPRVLAYLAKRLTGDHFNPERLGKVLGFESEDEFKMPSSVEDILDLDDGGMERLLGNTGDGILNLKQVGRLLPQAQGATQLNPNTFNGIQNAQNAGTHKNFFGKALLMHALHNPEMVSRYQQKEAQLRAPRIGARGQELTPLSDEKVAQQMLQFRREMIGETVGPLKAAATLFSLGRLGDGTHGALPKLFQSKASELLSAFDDNPEIASKLGPLIEGLQSDTDSWTQGLVDRYGGEGPHRFEEDDPGVLSAMQSNADWTKAIMASAEARKSMSEKEKSAFFSGLTPERLAKLQEPIYEKTDSQDTTPYISQSGQLKLTL